MDDLGTKVSYLVARRGIPVYSSDEVKLGTVVEVLDAPEADLFDGIIFDTTANRPGGHKFVDAPEVEGIYERETGDDHERTGDVLGATVELAELAALLTVLAWLNLRP